MKAHVLTGTKAQIAELVARIEGVVREVIVVMEDPKDVPAESSFDDMFAEMTPYMAHAENVDYSRESIYSPRADE